MRRLVIFMTALVAALPALSQNDGKKETAEVETMRRYTNFIVDEEYGDSIPPVVYDHMDEPPEYPGGIAEMDKFIQKNIKISSDTWKHMKAHPFYILGDCIIRKDGKAIFVMDTTYVSYSTNPLLFKETARVVSLMPRWKPARLNGQAADIFFRISTNIIEPTLKVPYCAVPFVKKAKRISRNVDRHYSHGVDKTMADSTAEQLLDIHKEGWDNIGTSMTGSRLLATLGRHGEAAEMLGCTLDTYHWYGFLKNINPTTGKYMIESWMNKDYYNPKSELEAAVTLAAICDMSGDADRAQTAYNKAIELIDMFLAEGMGEAEISAQEIQMRNDLAQEKAHIVDHSRSPGINLNSNDRYNIEREMILGQRNKEIDKRLKEGKISNARVVQITNKLKNMGKDRHDNETSPRLYKLKAMLIGLRDGHEAEKAYAERLANGEAGEKVAKHMAQWNKAVTRPVCGHKEALESIVFYAPLNVSGEKDETNRTAARRFYDNLKKMEKAYPLKWMRK